MPHSDSAARLSSPTVQATAAGPARHHGRKKPQEGGGGTEGRIREGYPAPPVWRLGGFEIGRDNRREKFQEIFFAGSCSSTVDAGARPSSPRSDKAEFGPSAICASMAG